MVCIHRGRKAGNSREITREHSDVQTLWRVYEADTETGEMDMRFFARTA